MGASVTDHAKTCRMLAAMAQMNAHPQVLRLLAEFGQLDLGDADEQHYIHGPIVFHETQWTARDLPEHWFSQARAERWLMAAGDMPGHIVGPTEIMLVMYAATMEAPMRHEAASLYLWATSHAIRRFHGDEKAKAMLDDLKLQYTDKDVISRGGYLWQGYLELTSEIRRKVIAAHLNATKGDRAAEREERRAEKEAATPPKREPPTAIQPSLLTL